MTTATSITTSPARARAIMGRNFFGIEEVIHHLGSKPLGPIKLNLATLAAIPFSEEMLEVRKDSHILVLRMPLSLEDIRNVFPPEMFWVSPAGNRSLNDLVWYGFAKNRGPVGWHLVARRPMNAPCDVEELRRLLLPNERVPSARVMMYTVITHFLATGEYLLPKGDEDDYARTSNIFRVGDHSYHVYLGAFDNKGLYVGGYGSSGWWDGIGFATEVVPLI